MTSQFQKGAKGNDLLWDGRGKRQGQKHPRAQRNCLKEKEQQMVSTRDN